MTVIDLDPRTADFLADPHPLFDALRAGGGVVRDPIGWSLISYDACEAAFHDRALIPGIDPLLEELGIGALWGVPGRTLTDSEGADHQRLRRAVTPWFTPRRIGALRDRTRALIDERLTGVGSEFDVMAQLADVVPSRLFCWMIGAPDADADLLARLSKSLLLVFTATPGMAAPVRAAKAELAEYAGALLARKRTDPGDDLASLLLAAAEHGTIEDGDVVPLFEELLSAAVDNTANTAGLALWTLATHPAQWRRLRDDPDLLAPAIEECGRFQPAIRHTIKQATADTEIAGTAISAGDYVTIRIAAAHRDPDVFEDPHRLDVSRSMRRPQLAFGAGRHYCLGAALGRMELQEMVGAVVARWGACEPADGVEMHLNASGHVVRLPLRLGATIDKAAHHG